MSVTVGGRRAVSRFFREVLLYSGQITLFYALFGFARDGLPFLADSGTIVLLSVALIQGALQAVYGGQALPRLILSFLTPFTYTMLALRSGTLPVLSPVLAGFWFFGFAFGAFEALALALAGRFAARVCEGVVVILAFAAFLLARYWVELGASVFTMDVPAFFGRLSAVPLSPDSLYILISSAVLALALGTGRNGLEPFAGKSPDRVKGAFYRSRDMETLYRERAKKARKQKKTRASSAPVTPEPAAYAEAEAGPVVPGGLAAESTADSAPESPVAPAIDLPADTEVSAEPVWADFTQSQERFEAGCKEYCVLHTGLWGLVDCVRSHDTASPVGTVNMLAEYFAEWALCAEDFGGFPSNVSGGSAVILFGESARPDPCRAAVECAVSMRERWPSVRTRLSMGGSAVPERFGVGLSVGKVLVGEVRAGNAVTFGAIGPAATEAARLVAAHERVQNDFCLTGEVHARLDPGLQDRFVRLGSLGPRDSERQTAFYGIKNADRSV